MCQRMKVSRSGFYAWQQRGPSARSHDDAQLLAQIHRAHQASRGFYGSPRVTWLLRHQGWFVGRGRVARLMRLARLQGHGNGLFRRKQPLLRFFAKVPNQILDLQITEPNRIWHGDVTYLKVAGAWRYLAVVMDRYSRRIVGWSISTQRTAALTIDALRQAIRARKPRPGTYFHSDRGIEYAALDFKAKLRQHGFVQSMNRPSNMNDNAHMESFFHSLKVEGLFRQKFESDRQLSEAVIDYIQFYNQQRLHSSLGFVPPAAYERGSLTATSVH